MSPKRKTMFVIFAGPEQHGRPGTRYIAKDGSKTEAKSHAAKFYSHVDAAEFAKTMNIKLTELIYIGPDDFTSFEIEQGN
jgi:hypothetical protein